MKPVAYSTHRFRVVLKAVEVAVSVVFLVLSAKAFVSHFYNDLRHHATTQKSAGVGLPKA